MSSKNREQELRRAEMVRLGVNDKKAVAEKLRKQAEKIEKAKDCSTVIAMIAETLFLSESTVWRILKESNINN